MWFLGSLLCGHAQEHGQEDAMVRETKLYGGRVDSYLEKIKLEISNRKMYFLQLFTRTK